MVRCWSFLTPPSVGRRAAVKDGVKSLGGKLESMYYSFGKDDAVIILDLPDNVAVRVHDSTADMRYLVLPMRPAGTDGWSEEALAPLVSRDTMVGVAVPVKA